MKLLVPLRRYVQVEYIGSQASVACQLPDIDRTVKEVLSRKQRTSPGNYLFNYLNLIFNYLSLLRVITYLII